MKKKVAQKLFNMKMGTEWGKDTKEIIC